MSFPRALVPAGEASASLTDPHESNGIIQIHTAVQSLEFIGESVRSPRETGGECQREASASRFLGRAGMFALARRAEAGEPASLVTARAADASEAASPAAVRRRVASPPRSLALARQASASQVISRQPRFAART